jgi:hypothetical protein
MILAWSGSAGAIAARLLNAQSTTFEVGSVQAFDGSLSLLSASKLDKAKSTGVVGVRIAHNVGILDVAKFLEGSDEILISDAGSDASDEEVGARVFGAS